MKNVEDLRKYEFCPSCERRMFIGLFDGHAACCTCRGVDANGFPLAKGTKGDSDKVEGT